MSIFLWRGINFFWGGGGVLFWRGGLFTRGVSIFEGGINFFWGGVYFCTGMSFSFGVVLVCFYGEVVQFRSDMVIVTTCLG